MPSTVTGTRSFEKQLLYHQSLILQNIFIGHSMLNSFFPSVSSSLKERDLACNSQDGAILSDYVHGPTEGHNF